eukprot:scaffold5583_cov106-Isochrysis_galbana.AAC.3
MSLTVTRLLGISLFSARLSASASFLSGACGTRATRAPPRALHPQNPGPLQETALASVSTAWVGARRHGMRARESSTEALTVQRETPLLPATARGQPGSRRVMGRRRGAGTYLWPRWRGGGVYL